LTVHDFDIKQLRASFDTATCKRSMEMEYIPIRRPELKRFLAIDWNRSSCSTNPLLENIVKFITESPEM
jgi:hypothetical protein